MNRIFAGLAATSLAAILISAGAAARRVPDVETLREAIAASPDDAIAAVVEPQQECDRADPMCIIRVRVVEVLLQRHKLNPKVVAGEAFMLYVGAGAESGDVKIGCRLLVVGTPLDMHSELVGYTARAMMASPDEASTNTLREAIRAGKW